MHPRDSFTDHHSIETPEQVQLDLAVAGIGSRFLALAMDTVIQLGLLIVGAIILGVLGYALPVGNLANWGTWLIAALVIVVFLLMYGYFMIFEIVWNGQTPGKRMVGIRVIKDTGRPLTVGETIGRNLLRIVDQIPTFYAVGVICALLNSENKRLGDLLVGAILVRETSLQELKPLWQTPEATSAPMDAGASNLSVNDLRLIDAFLARRHTLDVAVRRRTAEQILTKLNVELPADCSLTGPMESILEAMAYQRRSAGHMGR